MTAEQSALKDELRNRGVFRVDTFDDLLRGYGITSDDGTPRPTRQPSQETIRRDAGKLFHQEKMGDLRSIGGEVTERYPELAGGYNQWMALHDKGSAKAPLGSIGEMLSSGGLGSRESQYWGLGDDKITADSTIQRMYDDVAAKDSLGFVGEYEKSGRHMQDFPSKWGLDPATQSAINPYAQPSPDEIAQEQGFENAAALWQLLVQKNAAGEISNEALAEAKLELQIQ